MHNSSAHTTAPLPKNRLHFQGPHPLFLPSHSHWFSQKAAHRLGSGSGSRDWQPNNCIIYVFPHCNHTCLHSKNTLRETQTWQQLRIFVFFGSGTHKHQLTHTKHTTRSVPSIFFQALTPPGQWLVAIKSIHVFNSTRLSRHFRVNGLRDLFLCPFTHVFISVFNTYSTFNASGFISYLALRCLPRHRSTGA